MHNVICFMLTDREEILSSWALDLRMESNIRILVPLSSAMRQLINDIVSLSIIDVSRFDPVLSYVSYFRSGEVD